MNENNEHSYHSLYIDSDKCIGHVHCLKACPTGAIRIKNGKARIISDRCTDCGECITACDVKAIVPLTNSFTDFSRFKHTIAIPSPVLYCQFGRDILPAKIQKGLLKLGFSEVADVSDFCESVSMAIEEYIKQHKAPKPLITAFCPVIVRLVQIKYPELVDNLLPVESPRELFAKEIRKKRAKELGLKEEEIGLIYITPCSSKMIAIKEYTGGGRSNMDGAISIADLYSPLLQVVSDIHSEDDLGHLKRMSSYGLSWAMLGGASRLISPENWLAVSGIHDVIKIFSDIEDRKISEVELIEADACVGGCIGGSLTVDNLYVSRTKGIRLARQADKKKRWSARKIQKLFKEGHFDKAARPEARPAKPLDKDITKAIEKMKSKEALFSDLPKLDCGACGSPDCEAFAEDVVLGYASITDCHIKREELTKKERSNVIKFIKE